MTQPVLSIPERFLPAYRCIQQLEQYDRYLAAYIFGTEEHQWLQFMFFHGNDKVQRNLDSDPVTALLVMHVGLNDFLKYHYQLQQRWWVSSKRLLADLRQWDLPLAQLLEQFVTTADAHAKFGYWSAIIDHILGPLGGRQPISENNCDCKVCQHDLAMIYGEKR